MFVRRSAALLILNFLVLAAPAVCAAEADSSTYKIYNKAAASADPKVVAKGVAAMGSGSVKTIGGVGVMQNATAVPPAAPLPRNILPENGSCPLPYYCVVPHGITALATCILDNPNATAIQPNAWSPCGIIAAQCATLEPRRGSLTGQDRDFYDRHCKTP